MTEKEKSLAGYMYQPNDPELVRDRDVVKTAYFNYNNMCPTDYEGRREAMRKILGSSKENLTVEQPFYCTYGYNIEVGENFYANIGCTFSDGGRIKIGDNVFIAPKVSLLTEGHAFDPQLRNDGWEYCSPVTIGNNVWICANVMILPGVTVGDNVIIGAGSVVSRDIPSGVLAVGNPCRVVRKITEEDKHRFQWVEE